MSTTAKEISAHQGLTDKRPRIPNEVHENLMEQIDEQARAQPALLEAIESAHLYMKVPDIKGEASCMH